MLCYLESQLHITLPSARMQKLWAKCSISNRSPTDWFVMLLDQSNLFFQNILKVSIHQMVAEHSDANIQLVLGIVDRPHKTSNCC